MPLGYYAATGYVLKIIEKKMINRSALILKYKEPFVRWINEADPYKDDPGIAPENANEDRTVYLITEDDAENIEKWIALNWGRISVYKITQFLEFIYIVCGGWSWINHRTIIFIGWIELILI